ncbi:unnamed protein product [Thlaspi arvense]|uniref:Legume lectin domain-containing protein n=1 Tax=Thlaspi arvense TaxID=13288 RepID=A0AAU9RMB7_THLAR|nr:unnamed protein product [Thlaspi arvense]
MLLTPNALGLYNSSSFHSTLPYCIPAMSIHNNSLRILICLLLLPFSTNSITFNFSSFEPNMREIFYQGDAFAASGVIQVTKNQQDTNLTRSVGRASYAERIRLWDSKTGNIKNGAKANAWVSYNSTTKNLSVFLTYADKPVFMGNSSVFYVVDLRKVLPEWVSIGFSAATSQKVEIHNILSWNFTSNLEIHSSDWKRQTQLVVGLAAGFGALSCGFALFFFIKWRKRIDERKKDTAADIAIDDDDFEKGTGPRRFTFDELSRATKNFSEEGKLGEGGFGGVYKGLLGDTNAEIARYQIKQHHVGFKL